MNVAVPTSHLNIISLCTGGGGLDLGVGLAMPSARSVCCVEREAFAVSHLVSAMQKGLMAEAPIWSDVTTFNGRPWRGIVDGLIGGIPCQPHSIAGKRLGEDDERDLWSDARRIIVQSGAWFVLIENVRGMLTSGGAERVWRDLRRLGFEVEGGLFTASEVGASHERERVFILAVADAGGEQWRTWRQPSGGTGRAQSQPTGSGFRIPGIDVGHANHARLERHGQYGERPGERPFGPDGLELVNATGERRGEGRTEPEFRSGRGAASRTSAAMGNPVSSGHDRRPDGEIGRSIGRAAIEGASREPDGAMANSDHQRQLQPRGIVGEIGRRSVDDCGLFPPGPSDLSSWRHTFERAPELEPAFRRMADGLASRLDIARVDRLRLLGNGVVSLEGAYAFRTLATRLAASGSLGAARLVRAMELVA